MNGLTVSPHERLAGPPAWREPSRDWQIWAAHDLRTAWSRPSDLAQIRQSLFP